MRCDRCKEEIDGYHIRVDGDRAYHDGCWRKEIDEVVERMRKLKLPPVVYQSFTDAYGDYESGRFLKRIGDPLGDELLSRSEKTDEH